MKIRENVTFYRLDRNDRLLEVVRAHNLITLTGRNLMRDLWARAIPGTGRSYAPVAIALGDDNTAPTDLDTGLGNELYRDRITVRVPAQGALRVQLFLGLSQGNGETYREAGLFDNLAPNTGNCLARVAFADVPKDDETQLVQTWTMFFQNE